MLVRPRSQALPSLSPLTECEYRVMGGIMRSSRNVREKYSLIVVYPVDREQVTVPHPFLFERRNLSPAGAYCKVRSKRIARFHPSIELASLPHQLSQFEEQHRRSKVRGHR